MSAWVEEVVEGEVVNIIRGAIDAIIPDGDFSTPEMRPSNQPHSTPLKRPHSNSRFPSRNIRRRFVPNDPDDG